VSATAHNRPSIPIEALGAVALGILRANERGRVLAVFRRSFYVAFADDVVCIGPLDLGLGPLAALHAADAPSQWPDGAVHVDAEVTCAGATFTVGRDLRFDVTHAEKWRPVAEPRHSASKLRVRLQLLRAATERRSPGGLGALLPALCASATPPLHASEDPVVRAAAPAIGALCDWLTAALRGESSAPPAVDGLIGLGAGLTPSGDDFLGGIMIALHRVGRADLAGALARRVMACVKQGTSVISAAYLRCAAEGQGFKVLLDALDCMLAGAGSRLDACLDAVADVGHTSGWDCLTGSIAVCGALAHDGAARHA
jgi:hypothetical protein